MPTISAAYFIDWLLDPAMTLQRTPDQPVRVEGPVVLVDSSKPIARQRLEDFDFTGHIDLSNARFPSGLHMANCSAPEVSLTDAWIDGSLTISGERIHRLALDNAVIKGALEIGDGGKQWRIGGISLANAEVERSLLIDGGPRGSILIDGSVNMRNARIGGDLTLFNIQVGENVDLANVRVGGAIYLLQAGGLEQSLTIRGMLLATNAQVHGDFIVRGATVGTSTASGNLAVNLASASIGGNTEFSPALSGKEIAIRGDIEINGHVNAEGLRCRGRFLLEAVTITGDLLLNFSELAGFWGQPVQDRRVWIGGSLYLNTVKNRPWISLQGISIVGELQVFGSETSDLHVTIGWLSSGTEEYEHDIMPSTIGRFVMRSTEVKGSLQLPFIQVNGTKYDADRRGVVIEGSTIGGSVEFWSPWKIRDTWRRNSGAGDAAPCPIHCWRYSAAVIGDIRIENSVIGGELNLSFAKATGRIDLAGSHVVGGVLFCSTQTASAEIEDPAEKVGANREHPLDPLMRASASEVVLRMLRVDNDLDLTGLSVFRDSRPDNPRSKQSGGIDATHLRVRGKIKAHETSDGTKTYIEVPGKFDLSNARAAELEISGDSFPLEPAALARPGDNYPNGIVLSGGTIDSIVIPEIDADSEGRPYPVALDDLSVKTWEINAGTNDVRPYLHLLRKDRIFRRSNYTAIETYLRNRGEDHPATKVYREMWKRERAELSKNFDWRPWHWNWQVQQWEPRFWRWMWPAQFLRWVKLCFYGPVLGFGTNLWPLFIFILLLGVLAYPIYRHPANIEASLSRLATHPHRDHNKLMHGSSPQPGDWTNADAVWMEFRYQVPIIALALRDEWTMRQDPRAIYDLSAFWTNEGFPSCVPKDFADRLPRPLPPCSSPPVFAIPIGAEDVAGIFTTLNYIMWPLLIAFLLRKVLRTRDG